MCFIIHQAQARSCKVGDRTKGRGYHLIFITGEYNNTGRGDILPGSDINVHAFITVHPSATVAISKKT